MGNHEGCLCTLCVFLSLRSLRETIRREAPNEGSTQRPPRIPAWVQACIQSNLAPATTFNGVSRRVRRGIGFPAKASCIHKSLCALCVFLSLRSLRETIRREAPKKPTDVLAKKKKKPGNFPGFRVFMVLSLRLSSPCSGKRYPFWVLRFC